MITDFGVLRPDDPLERAIKYHMAGFQQDFPVVDDGTLVGVLTRNGLAAAIARQGASARVKC